MVKGLIECKKMSRNETLVPPLIRSQKNVVTDLRSYALVGVLQQANKELGRRPVALNYENRSMQK